MQKKYLDLQNNRDLGGITNRYLAFLKQNISFFSPLFLRYNLVFILPLLGTSYLLVTGFTEINNLDKNIEWAAFTESTSFLYLSSGGFLLLITFIFISALNYCLASSCIVNYEMQKTGTVDKEQVWNIMKEHRRKIINFMLLSILLYIGLTTMSIIISLIPLLGSITTLVIHSASLSWIGISFIAMMHENIEAKDSLVLGWKLLKENFWNCIGANLVIGLVYGLVYLILTIICISFMFFYLYFASNNDTDIWQHIISTPLLTTILCMFWIITAFSQFLSQFMNGILYYNFRD